MLHQVRRRYNWAGMLVFGLDFVSKSLFHIKKLVSGGFTITMELLLGIEEQAQTEDDLQTNLQVANDCGVTGTKLFENENINCSNKVELDECERAAEIYQCGKEKAPNVTSAVQDALTNTEVDPEVLHRRSILKNRQHNYFPGLDCCSMRSSRHKVLQVEGFALHCWCCYWNLLIMSKFLFNYFHSQLCNSSSKWME